MNKVKSLKSIGSSRLQSKDWKETNTSILRKQKFIEHQLKLFPVYGTNCESLSMLTDQYQNSMELTPEKPKKKSTLKRGRSLDIEKKKMLPNSAKFLKKTIEHPNNVNKDNSPLRKKRKNKLIKEQSFSRVSIQLSQPTFSIPSSQNGCAQSEFHKLQEQNKLFKKTIQKQLRHIRSLETIIRQL